MIGYGDSLGIIYYDPIGTILVDGSGNSTSGVYIIAKAQLQLIGWSLLREKTLTLSNGVAQIVKGTL